MSHSLHSTGMCSGRDSAQLLLHQANCHILLRENVDRCAIPASLGLTEIRAYAILTFALEDDSMAAPMAPDHLLGVECLFSSPRSCSRWSKVSSSLGHPAHLKTG